MSRPAFVYALADASGVRYVGRTVDPVDREKKHRAGGENCAACRRGIVPTRVLILEAVEAGEANEAEQKWIRCLSQRHPLVNVLHNRRPEILEAERIRRLESQRRYPRANPIRRSRSMNLKNPTILQLIVAAGFRKQREVVDKAASVGVVLPGSSLSCMVRGELGHPSARLALAKVLGKSEAQIIDAIRNSAEETLSLARAQSKK